MKMNNPSCPRCGSHMLSNGILRWRCTQCGYGPGKFINPRVVCDYNKRPPCPRCGKYHSVKHGGLQYQCGNCGRCYQKDWQAQQAYQEEITKIRTDAVTD